MTENTATVARTFETGDVVWAQPVTRTGENGPLILGRRKGIVLEAWAPGDTKRVLVWFYGLGPASGETVFLMFRSELTPAGDIWDFSARTADRLHRQSNGYFRVDCIRGWLRRHADRMASVGAKYAI